MLSQKSRIDFKLFFDKKFITRLLSKKLGDQFKKIDKIEIFPVKRYNKADFQHCVNCYKVHGVTPKNEYKEITVYCSAHSDGSRKKTYKVMKFIYKNFSERKELTATRPLFYHQKLKACFYQGVRGQNLFGPIHREDKSIEPILKMTSHWLAVLHRLSPPRYLKLIKIDDNFFDPSGILYKLKQPYKPYKKKILAHIKLLQKHWLNSRPAKSGMVLCHGDLNLENIIVQEKDDKINKLAIIDYTDLGLADRSFDLGYFKQRLERKLIYQLNIPPKKMGYLFKNFLKNYLKYSKIKRVPELNKNIIFFEAVSSLKWIIYCLYLNRGVERINYYLKYFEDKLKQIGLI